MGRPDFNPIRDLLSGVIMAATSIPQLIAYAETVGYAGYRGLSTAGLPLAAWGLITGSPFMNAGVTSITALMAKSDLAGESYVAQYGELAYVNLVAAYSLYVGLASAILAVVGFGKLAKSVPKVVSIGFKWGCAVGVLVSAVPNGFYLQGSTEVKRLAAYSLINQWSLPLKPVLPSLGNVVNVVYTFSHPWTWGVAPTFMFIVGTYLVMNGKKYLPAMLPPGSEVILVTAIATAYSTYSHYEGSVVGEIPTMDPSSGVSFLGIRIPVEFLDVRKLIMEVPLLDRFGGSWLMLVVSSLIFAAVNFLSIMGIASGFESENGIPWNAERELLAQGVSCAVAASVGSAPVSGSMSRSLVARMTGATSQLACLVTAMCWIYLQPYMSIMSPTPKAALSAVVVSAVLRGVFFPKDLLQLKGLDSFIGWGTGIGTVAASPTQGFAVGLILYVALTPFRTKTKDKLA